MSIIENIRSKPHSYKIRLMWIIIICVAVILILVWILVNRMGDNFNLASLFFKERVKEIQVNGEQMYEENN